MKNILPLKISDSKLESVSKDYEKYEKENGLNIDLFKELKNCVYKNIKDIIKIIDNNQYDITSYNAFRKKYISQLDGNSTQKMMKLIEEAL